MFGIVGPAVGALLRFHLGCRHIIPYPYVLATFPRSYSGTRLTTYPCRGLGSMTAAASHHVQVPGAPFEPGSAVPIIVPTLLLPEVASAVSRGREDEELAREFTAALSRFTTWC